MMKKTSFQEILELYIKFVICFLVIFIPARNALEMFLGTYIKVIPDLMIILMFAAHFFAVKGRIKISLCDWAFGLFFLIAFINTVIINKISIVTYVFEVRSMIVYYVLFFVIRNMCFEQEFILKITKLLRIVTYALFVLGVIEKIGNKYLLFPDSIAEGILYADNYARVYSMFFNPNTYGAFLVLSFFIVIYFEKEEHYYLYKVITLVSLLLSMSRSSIIIFAIGVVAYMYLFRKKGMVKSAIAILFVSLVIYLGCEKVTQYIWYYGVDIDSTTVSDRFNDVFGDDILRESNTDGRLYFVKTGLKVFKDYPVLGTGFGTYGSAASKNWEPPIYERYDLPYGFYSDNEYIKDLVETGIVGLGLLCAFGISLLIHYKKDVFAIFMCVIVAWFGLFYNVLEVQIVSFLFWTLLGLKWIKMDEQ